MHKILARTLLVGAALLVPAATQASPGSRTAFIQTVHQFVASHGHNEDVPDSIAGALKLNDGSSAYRICGLNWDGDDKSARGIDEIGDGIVVGYMPGDHSHALVWRLSADGTVTATVLWDQQGAHAGSAADYSDELENQINFWNALFAKTGVQWGGYSCSPTK